MATKSAFTDCKISSVLFHQKTASHGRSNERDGMAGDTTQECERCKCKTLDRLGRCIDCSHENDTAVCSCDDCIMWELEDDEDEDLESE